jgi:hypothetical protein
MSGNTMKRFRLRTLMLLIAIVGLSIALVVLQRRASRREAELQARLSDAEKKIFWLEHYKSLEQWRAAAASRLRRRPEGDRGIAQPVGR